MILDFRVLLGWKERVGCSSEGSSDPEHDSADVPPQMEVGRGTCGQETTQYRDSAGNAIKLQRIQGRVGSLILGCCLRKQSATSVCQATFTMRMVL